VLSLLISRRDATKMAFSESLRLALFFAVGSFSSQVRCFDDASFTQMNRFVLGFLDALANGNSLPFNKIELVELTAPAAIGKPSFEGKLRHCS
jgi:hypothetical protein